MKFSWSNSSERTPPKLFITSQDTEFDPITLQNWQAEGFSVSYLPFTGAQREFERQVAHIPDPLELGEKYAIIAYGDAASVILELAQKPMPKLCAVVAYYPTRVPAPSAGFPSSLNICVHLTGNVHFAPKYKCCSYPDARPGFAEVDLEVHDKIAAGLAWSRTLAIIRKGFEIEVDLESVWDNHVNLEFKTKDADATMATMVREPYVNHVPTITGGIGYKDLRRFYADYFIPGNPPSMKIKLVSRTVGTDRVVDEMLISFCHTQEIPWILPSVKPTNKFVEVAAIVVVCIRGGKLYHEHIYWDQATVLVQIGLLDPKVVPNRKFATRLPIVGVDSARKVLDESAVKSNELLRGW